MQSCYEALVSTVAAEAAVVSALVAVPVDGPITGLVTIPVKTGTAAMGGY